MLLRVHSASPATPTSRIVRLNLERTRFRYRAGQAVLLGLPGQDQRRPYSIASAPEDARAQGYLEFLIKTDAEGRFGPHLAGLRRGTRVEVGRPLGSFVFPDAARRPDPLRRRRRGRRAAARHAAPRARPAGVHAGDAVLRVWSAGPGGRSAADSRAARCPAAADQDGEVEGLTVSWEITSRTPCTRRATSTACAACSGDRTAPDSVTTPAAADA